MFGNLFKPAPAAALPAIPPGQRVYAIGDVHGRLDLLDRLIGSIDDDDGARGPAATTIVFLGDLIDRGPASAGVVARVIEMVAAGRDVRFVMGNHEELFLAALDDRQGAMRLFTRVGGQETILSYPISEAEYEAAADYSALAALCRDRIPAAHRAFVAAMAKWVEIGDYLFVHAGVRPGVPLVDQREADLRWIRDGFLDHHGSFGRMIVHGHTITRTVDQRANRIGIDTGAVRHGRLTALGLQGTDRWILEAADDAAD